MTLSRTLVCVTAPSNFKTGVIHSKRNENESGIPAPSLFNAPFVSPQMIDKSSSTIGNL